MKRMDPWWPLIAGCIAAAVIGIVGCGSVGAPAPYHTPNGHVAQPATQATDAYGETCSSLDAQGYCPGDDPSPTPAPPQYTASQQQAINAATNYLSDGQGFSYQGLVNQLTSQYGNGFSVADATFAVNTLNPDWNQQAAAAAKNYMSDGQGFSCSGLLQQLTSSYGNGFTHAQAEYGVQSVGLGTC